MDVLHAALMGHFEGGSYRNCNVEDVYSALEHICYEGEQKGFNLEKFVEKHNEAFLELSCNGEPVLETKKVHDFLSRISDLEVAAAKQQVSASPALLANLQEAANFIALSVTPLTIYNRDTGAFASRTGTTIQAKMQTTATSVLIAPYGRGIRGQNLRTRDGQRAFSPNAYGQGCAEEEGDIHHQD
jgi:hypothetical protein